jgi:hypothetical protein
MVEIFENPELKWVQEPCEYLPGLHCHDYMIEEEYTSVVLADDWQCGGGVVTKIQWWGNYEEDAAGNEIRRSGIDYFHLSIHADSPDGCLPVDPEIWGVNVPFNSVNEQFTGLYNNENGKIYLYEYILEEPFDQIAGNRYWLDIAAFSVDPVLHPYWRWQESNRSTSAVLCPAVNKYAGSPWSHISWVTPPPVRFSEMAFALISEFIPDDEFDFGDAPDEPYPTLLANDGARHIFDPDVYLGNLIDTEPDGQPTANADGDDLNILDDEDGVTFKPVIVGQMATVKVIASVDGFLNAWLDFNMNGSWADAGDQIFNDKPLSAGINNLTFSIPAGIDPGATYARFRFNTAGGLNYIGLAQDGEVEDYRVIIYPEGWGFTPTGSTHVIAVPLNVLFNCISLAAGDFLGTFHTDDDGDLVCGGAAMWDTVNNQVVVAYGDDQTTAEKDGFDDGETFTWKVYYTASGAQEDVNVAYDNALPDSDGNFVTNGLSALTDITKPMFATATADPAAICEGDQVQLDASFTGGCGPVSYSWSSSPAGFTSSIKNPSDNPVVTTVYHVQVTNTYGDVKTASVQVVVYPLPQVDCPAFMEACEGDPLVVLNSAFPQGGQYSGVGISFDGTNYVFDPGVGPGVYVITYCYTDADTECTACCEFDFYVNPALNISIFEGWSGISSYLVPDDPDLDVLLNPIMDELIILSNFDGMYWPGGNTYTIYIWDEYSGYAIKVSADTELSVCGDEVVDKTVNLNQGWNLIPVLSNVPYDVVNLFNGVTGFQIAKEVAGSGIYWPMFAINTIGNFDPGKAYFVRMNASGSIDYSSVKSASPIKPPDISTLITPWNDVHPMPGSHIVVFNLDRHPFENGDIIGGFTDQGYCSGLSLLENVDAPFTISLYGDDPFSEDKTGFESGEQLSFSVYRPSTGEVFEMEASYNPDMNSGQFENHGLSEVNQVKLSATGIDETETLKLDIFPNPTDGMISIEGINEQAVVTIFNAHGVEVFSGQMILPDKVDLSTLPHGIYLLRIKNEESVFFKKLIRN